jgi:hypothetical protein
MNNIRKLRSRNYGKVIEVRVPVRFYWDKEGYDGFEFGPCAGCSQYEYRLLHQVINQLFFEHQCCIVAEYMRENHTEEWRQILDRIEAETTGIPQTFFDAFREDKK